jgi:hypothetical protein
MKFEKLITKACCGKTAISYKLGSMLTLDTINLLSAQGFVESKHFTAAGILYMESDIATITGRLNSNILQLQFKKDYSNTYFDDILSLL